MEWINQTRGHHISECVYSLQRSSSVLCSPSLLRRQDQNVLYTHVHPICMIINLSGICGVVWTTRYDWARNTRESKYFVQYINEYVAKKYRAVCSRRRFGSRVETQLKHFTLGGRLVVLLLVCERRWFARRSAAGLVGLLLPSTDRPTGLIKPTICHVVTFIYESMYVVCVLDAQVCEWVCVCVFFLVCCVLCDWDYLHIERWVNGCKPRAPQHRYRGSAAEPQSQNIQQRPTAI